MTQNWSIAGMDDKQVDSIVTQTDNLWGYNLDKGLRKWRLAKARLDSGIQEIINLNFIGDSVTEGYDGTASTIPTFSNNFVDKLRNSFVSRYENVGEGWIGNNYPVTVNPGRWAYTGTWAKTGAFGWIYGGNGTRKTSVNGNTATCTFNGTGVKLLFEADGSSDKASVSIDGGAAEIVNVYAGTTSVVVYTKTGLTDGQHTVVVSHAGAWGSVSFLGGYELKGTKGVRVNKLAVSGATIDTVYREFNMQACIDHWNPKLTVISMLANDFINQLPLTDFKSKYQTVITRALQFGDVVLTSVSGNVKQTTQTIPISEYRAILLELAKVNNIAYIDIAKRFGETWETANNIGYIHTDGTHPTAVAQQDVYNLLSKILLEN